MGIAVRGVIEAVEGVGLPLGDVVVAFAKPVQDVLEYVLEGLRDGGGVELEEELIEEGGGGAHDIADIVEAFDAVTVVWNNAAGEVGSDVLERSEAIGGRIPGAKFEGIDFVDCGVERNDLRVGRTSIGDENREWNGAILEIVQQRDGREGVRWSSISGVDKLVG